MRARRAQQMLCYEENLGLRRDLKERSDSAAMNGLDHEVADQFFLIRHDHRHLIAHHFTAQAHFLRLATEGLDLLYKMCFAAYWGFD